MKKYILIIFAALSVQIYAQDVKNGYDDVKAKQVTVMELGMGQLNNDVEYGSIYTFSFYMFPSGYKKWANTVPVNAKITQRKLNNKQVEKQTEYADSIKSDTKKRNEIELKNIADRNNSLSLAWASNQSKIESALMKFTGNLGKLSFYGATIDEVEHWKDYLHMYEFSIKVMRNGYQPNSKRDKEFNEIYNDIIKKNEQLCQRLVALRGIQEASKFAQTHAMTRSRRIGYYASESLQSWRKNAQSSYKKQ